MYMLQCAPFPLPLLARQEFRGKSDGKRTFLGSIKKIYIPSRFFFYFPDSLHRNEPKREPTETELVRENPPTNLPPISISFSPRVVSQAENSSDE